MKELIRHQSTMKTMFNRYHHYLLTGICTLFMVASMTLAGCDTTDSNPSSVTKTTEDVFGQSLDGQVVSADGATLVRSANDLWVELRMPVPEPGSYQYPSSGVAIGGEGDREVFTLWAFVFNSPEDCESANPDLRCDLSDFMTGNGDAGVFALDVVVANGSWMTLSGRITPDTEVYEAPPVPAIREGNPGFQNTPLQNPEGAEVHFAIAPHGQVDEDKLPEMMQTATGPPVEVWWLAIFE